MAMFLHLQIELIEKLQLNQYQKIFMSSTNTSTKDSIMVTLSVILML